jgi:hypothetical protein
MAKLLRSGFALSRGLNNRNAISRMIVLPQGCYRGDQPSPLILNTAQFARAKSSAKKGGKGKKDNAKKAIDELLDEVMSDDDEDDEELQASRQPALRTDTPVARFIQQHQSVAAASKGSRQRHAKEWFRITAELSTF